MTLLSGQSWSHSLSTVHSNTWKVVVTFFKGHALSWCLYSGVGILVTVLLENQFLGQLIASFNRNSPPVLILSAMTIWAWVILTVGCWFLKHIIFTVIPGLQLNRQSLHLYLPLLWQPEVSAQYLSHLLNISYASHQLFRNASSPSTVLRILFKERSTFLLCLLT